MIKYKTDQSGDKISRVEVDSETKDTVVIDDFHHKKVTNYEIYFDTFQDAKDYLILVSLETFRLLTVKLTEAVKSLEENQKLTENKD